MKLLRLSLITTAVLAVVGCKKEEPQRPPQGPVAVSVITIKEQPVEIQSELKGRLNAVSQAEVRPQITGIIKSIKAKDGAAVKQGDVLYKVDPAVYKAAYDQAVASLESIKADLSTAKAKSERYESLAAKKAISAQDADDAKSVYNKLLATLTEREAAVQSAKINLDYTDIKAPIDGILGISMITPGALVTANQANSINTITTLNPIYLDISQPSQDFMNMMAINKELKSEKIPVDLKFDMNSEPVVKGFVSSNELKVDQSTDSIKVRAIFDNPDKTLLPGMFAYAKITYGVKPNGIKIPLQTILRSPSGESSVLVVGSDNKAKNVNITTLYNSGSEAIVSSGLKAGDKVIFEGLDKIREGSDLNPSEKE